jgi:non-ribosomal peptide synthase protein (TIGR01720 family)
MFVTHCERIQAGIDLSEGPLLKAGLFRGSMGDRLLLVVHHLVIDGVSWRILLEDLSSLYQQYLAGEAMRLPLKTDSFRFWQHQQYAYARGDAQRKEEKYWSDEGRDAGTPLPLDYPNGANRVGNGGSSSFLMDEKVTGKLLTACYAAYHTGVTDILLTALSFALGDVFGLEKLSVSLEGHGREYIGGEVDVTRTLGWFTTMYPVVLELGEGQDMIHRLIEVKERLHRVPNKGIGYGILRYLAGKDYGPDPAITFNYLGDFGGGAGKGDAEGIFSFSGAYHGRQQAEDMERGAILDVSGVVVAGRLRIMIGYSREQYAETTIARLTDRYRHCLLSLVEKLSAETKVYITPVDLTYKGLTLEQVQKLNQII